MPQINERLFGCTLQLAVTALVSDCVQSNLLYKLGLLRSTKPEHQIDFFTNFSVRHFPEIEAQNRWLILNQLLIECFVTRGWHLGLQKFIRECVNVAAIAFRCQLNELFKGLSIIQSIRTV
jgi:hypothetical protein